MTRNDGRRIENFHKMTDMLIILGSWWASYYIRFSSNLIPLNGEPLLLRYIKFSVLLLAISYYFLSKENLYNSKRISPIFEELYSVVRANAIAFTVFIFTAFFLSNHRISRIFIVSYLILSTLALIASKLTVRKFLKSLYTKGIRVREILLVGDSQNIMDYAEKLKLHPETGLKVSKWIKDEEEIKSLRVEDIDDQKYSSIVFGVSNQNSHLVSQLLNDLNNLLVEIVVLPDLSHSFVGYKIVNMSGTTGILINEPNLSNRSVIIKRLFDIVCCGLGVIIISPLLFLIALLVKLTSKGPILYSQIRMGLDGKEFKMYKFRSMRTDSSNKETWTVKDDPRVTSIGKFLRKTSLDEFPQLFNVLLGDMSLVGPRPERPIFVHEFKKDIPTYMLRHKMKAGITGWAQINGWRGDTSIEKRIECDLYYIKHWSIWLDIWIIFMTFWKGFINKNAY